MIGLHELCFETMVNSEGHQSYSSNFPDRWLCEGPGLLRIGVSGASQAFHRSHHLGLSVRVASFLFPPSFLSFSCF